MSDPAPTPTAPRSRRAAWIVAPVAFVMLVFIVVLATGDRDDKGFDSFDLVGQVAPSIVGTTIEGEAFDLDDHRGSFVIVNFFQTTCIPCRQEHPELVAFQEAYGPSGFATLVDPLGDRDPDVPRHRRVGLGDRLAVAHRAADGLGQRVGPIGVGAGFPLVDRCEEERRQRHDAHAEPERDAPGHVSSSASADVACSSCHDWITASRSALRMPPRSLVITSPSGEISTDSGTSGTP